MCLRGLPIRVDQACFITPDTGGHYQQDDVSSADKAGPKTGFSGATRSRCNTVDSFTNLPALT